MGGNRSGTITFTIHGPLTREDLPGLSERLCAALAATAATGAVCAVEGLAPDALTADVLARLQLAARRLGCTLELRGASPALSELIDFMGLADVLL